MELISIHEHIPILHQVTAIKQIHKGFSFDEKYLLFEGGDQPQYVLRTSDLQQMERKRSEYELIRRVYMTGVKTSEPIAFGTIESMQVCYMVLRFVIGEDGTDVLSSLTSDEQYHIGLEAGRELKLMHELQSPADMAPWHIRRLAKHERQYAAYRGCGVRLSEEDAIVSFIEANLPQMIGRPDRFQHDDFHPSNLLIHNRSYAGVIDYNRYDWGDPYHDFLKVAYFSREVSIPFSIGQIYGYFEGQVPDRFWKLYALYAALIVFPSITWTLQVVPEQLESMLDRIRVVLDDHRNFESAVPVWYKP
ncbi:phosphotransferase family protein [Paenibacillus mendelii]|uniref:Phosphotransferase family protein n=1 Tax=Paenibacillus mendelii TaxID=206163 RepID=A0ABV6J6Q7_9BACL|nr:phosphotransferase [Paenibacillus mendelii]MCQ6561174.1 phosphotransferase [Paenibacillus mendelii]